MFHGKRVLMCVTSKGVDMYWSDKSKGIGMYQSKMLLMCVNVKGFWYVSMQRVLKCVNANGYSYLSDNKRVILLICVNGKVICVITKSIDVCQCKRVLICVTQNKNDLCQCNRVLICVMTKGTGMCQYKWVFMSVRQQKGNTIYMCQGSKRELICVNAKCINMCHDKGTLVCFNDKWYWYVSMHICVNAKGINMCQCKRY